MAIPQKIPTHYGFGGQPDAWGNKSSCVVPLVIGGVMWLMMWGIEQVPMIWNTGVMVTEVRAGETARALEYEVAAMEQAVRTGDVSALHLDWTQDVMHTMTALRQEWGVCYPGEEL